MASDPTSPSSLEAPVSLEAPQSTKPGLVPGIALCLSGGGYRAMVFHIGALWRLNDAGLLGKLDRVSSVSGGSITAGVLALAWKDLGFDARGYATAFRDRVVEPLREMASTTIDEWSVIGGILTPGVSVGEKVAANYRRHLFGDATLQNLPDHPRFVINATNVQSGALWRFMKPYMRDWRVGEVKNPVVPLATAVAASSAFPPVLSPVRITLRDEDFTPNSGDDLQRPPFTTEVVLSDGGVYDNLGLETAWKLFKTVLVSDAGLKMAPEEEPKSDWGRHSMRVLDLVDNQVRSLRKRQLIGSYRSGERLGCYWGVRTHIDDYQLPDPLPCPLNRTAELAAVPTRLQAMNSELQERLINWGYAVCDAALRRHYDPSIPRPGDFPYSATGV